MALIRFSIPGKTKQDIIYTIVVLTVFIVFAVVVVAVDKQCNSDFIYLFHGTGCLLALICWPNRSCFLEHFIFCVNDLWFITSANCTFFKVHIVLRTLKNESLFPQCLQIFFLILFFSSLISSMMSTPSLIHTSLCTLFSPPLLFTPQKIHLQSLSLSFSPILSPLHSALIRPFFALSALKILSPSTVNPLPN